MLCQQDGEYLGPRIGDKTIIGLLILSLFWGIGNNFEPTNVNNLAAVLFSESAHNALGSRHRFALPDRCPLLPGGKRAPSPERLLLRCCPPSLPLARSVDRTARLWRRQLRARDRAGARPVHTRAQRRPVPPHHLPAGQGKHLLGPLAHCIATAPMPKWNFLTFFSSFLSSSSQMFDELAMSAITSAVVSVAIFYGVQFQGSWIVFWCAVERIANSLY